MTDPGVRTATRTGPSCLHSHTLSELSGHLGLTRPRVIPHSHDSPILQPEQSGVHYCRHDVGLKQHRVQRTSGWRFEVPELVNMKRPEENPTRNHISDVNSQNRTFWSHGDESLLENNALVS